MKQEILKSAIEAFGVHNQIDMLHEEIGELLQAVNKLKRIGGISVDNRIFNKPTKELSVQYSISYNNLCSEVADCRIMLSQLEIMLNKETIDICEERKLSRLKDRVDNHNKK